MRISFTAWNGLKNLLNGSITKSLPKLNNGNLLVRTMVPKLFTPTIIDYQFQELIREKFGIRLRKSNIIKSLPELPFDILQVPELPINRLEGFFIVLSKLMNRKPLDGVSLRYEKEFKVERTLRTKLILPFEYVKLLRNDGNFRKFNSTKEIYIERLSNPTEVIVHLKVHSQDQFLRYIKNSLLKFQQNADILFEDFNHFKEEAQVLKFEDVKNILPYKVTFEHNSSCSLKIEKFNENYRPEDLILMKIRGPSGYQTVAAKRMLELSKKKK